MNAISSDGAAGLASVRVLLVEDNPIIAMNGEAMLLDLGVGEVCVAATVADALAHIDTAAFDVAFLDVKLGDSEVSLPVAERLAAEGVPLAFTTGMGDDMELPPTLAAAPILRKPYGFADIERMLRGLAGIG